MQKHLVSQPLAMGPSGLSLVLSKEIHIFRRILWLIVLVLGLIYSTYNIYENSVQFFSYKSSRKPQKLTGTEIPAVNHAA